MILLRFKDKKYVLNLLKIFTNKKLITFEITDLVIKISTLEPPYFYLTIPQELYTASGTIDFTINAQNLLENLEGLNSSLALLYDSFRIISVEDVSCDLLFDNILDIVNKESSPSDQKQNLLNFLDEMKYSFIDIPFTNPIQTHYKHINYFPTRFLINKNILRGFLEGTVHYLSKDQLILKKIDGDAEETMEIDVDYLEEGYLDFHCSNSWLENIGLYLDLVSVVLFCFGEEVLHIKFLFGDYKKAYMEIQILEKTTPIY